MNNRPSNIVLMNKKLYGPLVKEYNVEFHSRIDVGLVIMAAAVINPDTEKNSLFIVPHSSVRRTELISS